MVTDEEEYEMQRLADDFNYAHEKLRAIQKALKPALRFMEHTMPPEIMDKIREVMKGDQCEKK